ncbi:Claudin-8 [Oryzias melastigma]|uniref:Claudin n=1 Tax=Oryzias melastigma TaxID=30732 RepID=A0A834C8Z5_ORYME|nr:claudin-8-like [Oryzias melastigma]KAF6724945.1 Claudin-8 [Oryzias melastigma]
MKVKVEILALVLGVVSLVGTIAITALPTWKVSAFIGANLIVMEELQEGLWMTCYRHANFRMQCKAYDSLLILPGELQAGRGLMCLSIALVIFAIIVMTCGLKETSCCRDSIKKKNIVLAIGGSLYLVSCLTTLIPVCWVSHSIISDFYNPTMGDGQRRELGSAIYIGWATSLLLLITGVILLIRCSKRTTQEEEYYYEDDLPEGRDVQEKRSISLARITSSVQEYV